MGTRGVRGGKGRDTVRDIEGRGRDVDAPGGISAHLRDQSAGGIRKSGYRPKNKGLAELGAREGRHDEHHEGEEQRSESFHAGKDPV